MGGAIEEEKGERQYGERERERGRVVVRKRDLLRGDVRYSAIFSAPFAHYYSPYYNNY